MRKRSNLLIALLVLLILALPAFQTLAVAQTSSKATISGRVTFNGNYLDGVTVTLVGGNSVNTSNGGYYNFSVVPNIAVTITASYGGYSQTKVITASDAGTTVTQNFDLAPLATPTIVATSLGPNTASVIGLVKYNGVPLTGITVNVSPVTTVTTDMTGHYHADVPGGINVTISVLTAGGSDTKTIVTPDSGDIVVNLNINETGQPAATATPVATPTSAPTITATTNATVMPVSATANVTPTATATVISSAPTPTATPKPAGSESLVILSALGLIVAIGLIRRKK